MRLRRVYVGEFRGHRDLNELRKQRYSRAPASIGLLITPFVHPFLRETPSNPHETTMTVP